MEKIFNPLYNVLNQDHNPIINKSDKIKSRILSILLMKYGSEACPISNLMNLAEELSDSIMPIINDI